MERLLRFLQEAKVFYLATVEGDQPRVRPMGFIMPHGVRLYFCTNTTKPMYQQMRANPKIELCALNGNTQFLRAAGTVVFETDRSLKAKALEAAPQLRQMYQADDNIFILFSFASASVTISDLAGAKEEFAL
ncbi:MAG: pyridoxamine 5'-phosphate oxidase family protein [Treponema sp.]|jgi:uncharacterized pyridoxamine 5'-phosphate oxidase family protein|nr:pyridoxamine 5'-phosphate oxidase family protein [Treponema sp.]